MGMTIQPIARFELVEFNNDLLVGRARHIQPSDLVPPGRIFCEDGRRDHDGADSGHKGHGASICSHQTSPLFQNGRTGAGLLAYTVSGRSDRVGEERNHATAGSSAQFYPSISNLRNDTWPPWSKRSSQLLRIKPGILGLSSAVTRSLLRSSSKVKSPPPMRGRRNFTMGPSIPSGAPMRPRAAINLRSIHHSTRSPARS